MARRISKFSLSVLATLLVFAAVISMPTVSYSKNTSLYADDNPPIETISLSSGWYPCNDKGKEIATAFSYDDPSKIDVRPVQYITNGQTILAVNDEKDVSVDYLRNNSDGKAYAIVRGVGKYSDEFVFEFSIAPNPNESADTDIKENELEQEIPEDAQPNIENEEIAAPQNEEHEKATSEITETPVNTNTDNRTDTPVIEGTSVILYEGQVKQLPGKVEALSLDANVPVQWTSSNTAVATVDESGTLTAVGGGTACITVQTTDGTNRSGQCDVVVKTGQDIVDTARGALGVKYVWGGSNLTDGMDCSGLVVAVYKKVLGVKLPHFTGDLEKSDKFKTIDVSELQPGDILVRYGPGHKSGKHIRHVGIWTGSGVIDEDGGAGKCVEKTDESKVERWLANYTPRRYVG